MGLEVKSQNYKFGLTYELLSTREESKPDESDKTGGSWINSKLRVLVVASDVLKKAREIEPDSVVAVRCPCDVRATFCDIYTSRTNKTN